MELKNLGRKYGQETNVKSAEEQISYPEVTITEETLPALKGKDIGDTVNLIVEARLCGINAYKNGDTDYRLELLRAGIKEETA
jgi:hypothetical protein